MMTADPRPCPDASTLAAFAEGRLGRDEQEGVARHVADCAECPHVVAAVASLLDDDASAADSSPRRWLLAAAAAAALCITGATWWALQARDPMRRLSVLATRSATRPVEGMLHDFAHRPYDGHRAVQEHDRDLRIGALADSLERRGETASALHVRGLAKLLLGDSREAAPLLEKAARMSPDDAGMWSDLAAAEIARAAQGDRSALVRALDDADRALALDPDLASAHFNRALALERLDRPDDAADAFKRALATAPDGWSDEIRERIATVPTLH
jgi:tetratricopeptide (TPR) repeat protein